MKRELTLLAYSVELMLASKGSEREDKCEFRIASPRLTFTSCGKDTLINAGLSMITRSEATEAREGAEMFSSTLLFEIFLRKR